MKSYRARSIKDLKKYVAVLEEGDQVILWAYEANHNRNHHQEIVLSVLDDKLVFHTIKDVAD